MARRGAGDVLRADPPREGGLKNGPGTIFGAVPLSPSVARAACRTAFNPAAGGSFVGRGEDGHARLVVDEGRGVIVGATFVGVDVAESLHAATIAIVGEVPLDRLWHAVPSFPTISEVWLRLLEAYGL